MSWYRNNLAENGPAPVLVNVLASKTRQLSHTWTSWNDAWQGTYPRGFFVLKHHTSITFSSLFCLAERVSVFVVTVRDHDTWSGSVWVLSADSFYLTSRTQIFESPAINSFVARFREKTPSLPFLASVVIFRKACVVQCCRQASSTNLCTPAKMCSNSSRNYSIPLQTTSWRKLGQNGPPEFVQRVWHDFRCCA